jgi:hypothetical protein
MHNMLDLLYQVHCVFTCAGSVCPVTVKLLQSLLH